MIIGNGVVGDRDAVVAVHAKTFERSRSTADATRAYCLKHLASNRFDPVALATSVIASNPAMRDHFKTGQMSRAQDLNLF